MAGRKNEAPPSRCAIYTRKSHEEGLEQEFNSLHAQREAGEAYIASQRHEGWTALPADYSDGGFTGANIDRPGLQKLMADIERGGIDCVVVYKVDRLSRSLLDFARLIATFDEHDVSFVSVTQQFNTTTSMGRLTLNILLSFAQFEREIIGERIRDKKLATAMKGKYLGGQPLLGYDVDREKMRLLVNPEEAELVRWIFARFVELKSSLKVARELNAQGHRTKAWTTKKGKAMGGNTPTACTPSWLNWQKARRPPSPKTAPRWTSTSRWRSAAAAGGKKSSSHQTPTRPPTLAHVRRWSSPWPGGVQVAEDAGRGRDRQPYQARVRTLEPVRLRLAPVRHVRILQRPVAAVVGVRAD